MNRSSFFRCYRYYLSSLCRQPLNIFLMFLFVLLTVAFYLLSGIGHVTAFSGTTSFFSTIALVSLIILPALAIRIHTAAVSYEETFPVPVTSRVLGEVCALETLYGITLTMTIPLLVLPAKLISLESAPCVTSYFFLILYGFCIISFCVWISGLFFNPVFSYLVTIALLITGNTVHLLPIDAAWIKTVSFIWHFDSASKGIVAGKDLVFFTAVTAFCVAASVECIVFRKNSSNRRPLISLILEAVLLVLVIANGTYFSFRIDTTKDRRFSLSDESIAILQQIQEPLRITWYVSKTVLNRYPQADDMKKLMNQYASANPQISVTVVSDPDSLAAANLGQLGITPQAVTTSSSDETQTLQIYSAILLEMGDSMATIPFVLSNVSLEYDISFRIRSLIAGEVPVVAVLNGTGLDLNGYYDYLMPWITSSGMIPVEMTADQLHVLDGENRCILLVLGGETFTSDDVQIVDRWVMSGKPAFFAVSPVTVDIGLSWQAENNGQNQLFQLLDFYGVQFGNQLIWDPQCFTLTMYSSQNQSAPEYIPYPYWPLLQSAGNFGSDIQLFWPVELTLFDTELCRITPLITSSSEAVRISAPYVTNPFAINEMKETVNDYEKKPAVLGALLEGKLFSFYTGSYSSENRVMVVGDRYFLSDMVETTGSGQNFSFLISSILHLNGDDDLLRIKARWE